MIFCCASDRRVITSPLTDVFLCCEGRRVKHAPISLKQGAFANGRNTYVWRSVCVRISHNISSTNDGNTPLRSCIVMVSENMQDAGQGDISDTTLLKSVLRAYNKIYDREIYGSLGARMILPQTSTDDLEEELFNVAESATKAYLINTYGDLVECLRSDKFADSAVTQKVLGRTKRYSTCKINMQDRPHMRLFNEVYGAIWSGDGMITLGDSAIAIWLVRDAPNVVEIEVMLKGTIDHNREPMFTVRDDKVCATGAVFGIGVPQQWMARAPQQGNDVIELKCGERWSLLSRMILKLAVVRLLLVMSSLLKTFPKMQRR